MQFLVGTSAYNQHVQHMVRALYEADALHSFVTGGVDSFRTPLLRGLRRVIGSALPRFSRQLSRRSVEGLPSEVVRARWSWEAPRVVASQMHAARVEDWAWDHGEKALDRHCARLMRHREVDGFLGVEYGALASLKAAASAGKTGIVAFLSPHHRTRAAWVDREYAKYPELATEDRSVIDRLTPIRDARRDEEAATATWIVTGSSFTTRSLIDAGFDRARLLTVPLGGPEPIDRCDLPTVAPHRLTFVFVGPVSVRKGAHYLLRAWRRVHSADAELHFYGKVLLPDRMIAEARSAGGGDRLVFHGSVPAAELPRVYQQASALVLPTLCDGYGMVISEALANGLPVITTPNAGAADAIVDGTSGLLVPPADEDALTTALEWCMDQRSALFAMRADALAAAGRRTWNDFRVHFRGVLGDAVNDSRLSHFTPHPAVSGALADA